MRSIPSRYFLFGLLIGWALSHTTVFGQPGEKTPEKKAPPVDKLRAGLNKVITLDFTGQSLNEVLNHFRDKTGLSISVDQVAFMNTGINSDAPAGQLELKAKNERAGTVLRKFLAGYRLTYVIFEDSLLITTEEMALPRQYRQRVSVDVEDVPLKTAILNLARKRGISLVIDPVIKKQADTPVTLQLDNTAIETALRLLAELADVKAVRMGNVMFITTAAKAKSIREEEAHTFDSPLNPNMPIQGPTVIGGFGGGGIAFPGRVVPGGIPQIAPEGPRNNVAPPKAIPDAPPRPKGVVNPDGTSSSPVPPAVQPRPNPQASPAQRDPNDR
ncbi:MAG: hypothetical protein HYX68_15610 [Planctomycetes bacterium]|nr:hypothetical protein [Planctomycetota bacterium]